MLNPNTHNRLVIGLNPTPNSITTLYLLGISQESPFISQVITGIPVIFSLE